MAYPVGGEYICPAGGTIAAGRYVMPSWAPAAGELKTISYSAGAHPLGAGAVLEEIDPKYQSWNPDAPAQGPYGSSPTMLWSAQFAYCGYIMNTDTRQLVHYGSGHNVINVCAPYAFDLKDLRWKWLDTPLPFDAYQLILNNSIPYPVSQATMEIYYPPEQHDWAWGEINGSWSGWAAGYGRPGIIQPVPSHTRAALCHIPAASMGNSRGALFYHSRPTGKLGDTYGKNSHMFDYSTSTWSRNANQRALGHANGTVFDPVTKKVVVFGSENALTNLWNVFDLTTRTWSQRTASISTAASVDHGGNLVHVATRLHICPASRTALDVPHEQGTHHDFWAVPFDDVVGTGTFTPVKLNVNVVSTWPLTAAGTVERIGWQYCPQDKCLYAVNGLNASNKYWKLTPPVGAVTQAEHLSGTWTLTEHTFVSGAFVSSLNPVFAYQRLQWDVASRSFIWHNGHVSNPVMAWRPAGL